MVLFGFLPCDATGQITSFESRTGIRTAVLHANQLSVGGMRSVPLAAGLSSVVPGLGQAYNRQWVRAAVGLGAELAVVAAYASWRRSGVRGRTQYQSMAHDSWSPVRYGRWLNDYVGYLTTLPDNRSVSVNPITFDPALGSIDFKNPDSWSDANRRIVRDLIQQIRIVEGEVYHPETGAAFSHKLPFFGEQQYYELVGKYYQFAPGWEDYSYILRDGVAVWTDADGKYIGSIDPEKTAADGSKPNVSPSFLRYAGIHGEANDFLRRASRISILFFINRLGAAAEAAISAKLHNNRLRSRLELHPGSVSVGVTVAL